MQDGDKRCCGSELRHSKHEEEGGWDRRREKGRWRDGGKGGELNKHGDD